MRIDSVFQRLAELRRFDRDTSGHDLRKSELPSELPAITYTGTNDTELDVLAMMEGNECYP